MLSKDRDFGFYLQSDSMRRRSILNGHQPSTLQLDDLLKALPAAWDRQRSVLNIPQWPAPVERSPGRQN
jgi:hypothetical protein